MTVALINLIVLVIMFRKELNKESVIKVTLISLGLLALAVWWGV